MHLLLHRCQHLEGEGALPPAGDCSCCPVPRSLGAVLGRAPRPKPLLSKPCSVLLTLWL